MEHFICTGGCKGVASEGGVCNAKTCPKHGMPLEACDCHDGKHEGRQEENGDATKAERDADPAEREAQEPKSGE